MENIGYIIYLLIASIYFLFLPGFIMSMVFFDLKKIDTIERVALSFGLSISVIPFLSFYANLLGLNITFGLLITEVFFVSLVSGIAYYLFRFKKRSKND